MENGERKKKFIILSTYFCLCGDFDRDGRN